eukprot:6178970-Pleurochrysis_carterae.AAC.2
MSHDFGTPVAVLKMLLGLLRMRIESDEEKRLAIAPEQVLPPLVGRILAAAFSVLLAVFSCSSCALCWPCLSPPSIFLPTRTKPRALMRAPWPDAATDRARALVRRQREAARPGAPRLCRPRAARGDPAKGARLLQAPSRRRPRANVGSLQPNGAAREGGLHHARYAQDHMCPGAALTFAVF